ncbi:MAG: twitching motility protein PilT [Gammaproteobacteria bacterium]|nr:twitching motility protein PilT [Gammaproteobacteria bacterium]
MNILIDTHIFLWLIFEPQKISRHHMSYLEDLDNAIYLSAISIAEIMIKKSIGMLDVEFDLFDIIDDMGLLMLDFDVSSALYLGTLCLTMIALMIKIA